MSGYILEKAALRDGDMEQINRFTRRKFTEAEVYVFSLVLCDNEVDRDFERFSLAALEEMRALFIGKTCLFDHERKSANQTARIFSTEIRRENRKTAWGEAYTQLTARAYLPRTDKSQELITAIESGILKEVSVSCSVNGSHCSVCGESGCRHQKGRSYAGKLCHKVFEHVEDAYECSFVAVPAQRAAGVTKQYRKGEVKSMEEILKSLQQGEVCSFDSRQAQELSAYLEELREKALWGEQYRNELGRSILKYSALVQPEMPRAVMESAVKALGLQELKNMAEVYAGMAQQKVPLKPQLRPKKDRTASGQDNEFRI